MNTYTELDIARLCEIAIIINESNHNANDLEDFFLRYVEPVYTQWSEPERFGITFESEEQKGYITAYAQWIAKDLSRI